jgi:hypothetical protein
VDASLHSFARVKAPPVFLGLLRPRTCLLPTWRGWCALLLLTAVLATFAMRHAYAFLAPQDSRPGGFLVLEGWEPDYVLDAALAEMQQHPYDGLVVTGEPINKGAPLSEYRDSAEITVATLKKMGADPSRLHAALAAGVPRDRTYSMGAALREWLKANGHTAANINLMSLGVHARRSRLLFEKSLEREIGLITITDRDFDPEHWWQSSAGFRGVIAESLAYIYARFVFTEPTN